jgi:hypothetical protein
MESRRRNCQTSSVSTVDDWILDKACLSRALADWHATNPDQSTRDRVNEWLMDLVKNPLHRGKEEPEHPGIWFGRIAGTNVGVTFVPNVEQRSVCVVSIA